MRTSSLRGVKKVLIGFRACAMTWRSKSPEYVQRTRAQHHVGGYLKIAPEHVREDGPLSLMMKPGVGSYDRFKELFDKYSEGGRQGTVPDSRIS